MRHYPFHIGDYAASTRHLSLMEDLALRRILDLYYLNEKPPQGSCEVVARVIGMRGQVAAVRAVLQEFFDPTPEGVWRQKRVDRELEAYADKVQKAVSAGLASGRSRRSPANGRSTDVQRTFNGRSTDAELSKNQEPCTSTQSEEYRAPAARRASVEKPESVSQETWDGFLAQRKASRAPITQAALTGISREAEKAGWTLEAALAECCARGWRGFKADWIKGQAMKPSLASSKPVEHMRNMPFGTPSCFCDGCVTVRQSRAGVSA